jgi:flagellar protein FliS
MNRINIYNEIGETSEVLGAPSHRQVQLLLEKLVNDIKQSMVALELNNITKKCKHVSSANNIVIYLQECLNFEADAALSVKLNGIYSHLGKQLFNANSKNDVEAFQECQTIATNIKTWWDNVVA